MKEKPIWEQPGYDFDPPYPASTPVTTNYDRLISKTPEGLAVYLRSVIDCELCPVIDGCDGEAAAPSCSEILLAWLKSPADEEEEP